MRRLASGTVVVAVLACAQMQDPPGGPPDFTPPKLLKVTPDSGSVVPGWHDAVLFTFSETVTEPQDQQFQRLILVSPRPKSLHLGWHRTAISVEPDGGWKPNVTYRVELLPGVTDLRNNRMTGRTVLVFSTGSTIPTGSIRGTLIDWAGNRLASGALLEAISLPDSLAYVSVSDSTGDAVIDHLSPGKYLVVGTIDQNGNQRRDGREAFDSVTVQLDSAFRGEFWTFTHDTTGPRIRGLTLADSITAKIEFNQPLPATTPDTSAVQVVVLPDSTPVRYATLLTQAAFDSLTVVEQRVRARTDSIKQAARADSIRRAQPDTANPRLPPGVSRDRPLPPPPLEGNAAQGRGAGPDTARSNAILRKRPKLSAFWVIRFLVPVPVNARYVVRATASNLTGASQTSQAVLTGPKPPADTSQRGRGAGRGRGGL